MIIVKIIYKKTCSLNQYYSLIEKNNNKIKCELLYYYEETFMLKYI